MGAFRRGVRLRSSVMDPPRVLNSPKRLTGRWAGLINYSVLGRVPDVVKWVLVSNRTQCMNEVKWELFQILVVLSR